MHTISASDAKQNFGDLLSRAATAPVGIERHGKVVAVVVPPESLGQSSLHERRQQAREKQRQVEQRRLMAHQGVGIVLLSALAQGRRQIVRAALKEVERWESDRLCSQDYVDRWRAWLARPAPELVALMCSDADGWGPAMRQNSPFAVLAA